MTTSRPPNWPISISKSLRSLARWTEYPIDWSDQPGSADRSTRKRAGSSAARKRLPSTRSGAPRRGRARSAGDQADKSTASKTTVESGSPSGRRSRQRRGRAAGASDRPARPPRRGCGSRSAPARPQRSRTRPAAGAADHPQQRAPGGAAHQAPQRLVVAVPHPAGKAVWSPVTPPRTARERFRPGVAKACRNRALGGDSVYKRTGVAGSAHRLRPGGKRDIDLPGDPARAQRRLRLGARRRPSRPAPRSRAPEAARHNGRPQAVRPRHRIGDRGPRRQGRPPGGARRGGAGGRPRHHHLVAIGRRDRDPQRPRLEAVGLHVFNPVPKMKLVEALLPGLGRRGAGARARLVREPRQDGRRGPRQGGYVVNRLLFPLPVRRRADDGADRDERGRGRSCMTLGAGHPMGPWRCSTSSGSTWRRRSGRALMPTPMSRPTGPRACSSRWWARGNWAARAAPASTSTSRPGGGAEQSQVTGLEGRPTGLDRGAVRNGGTTPPRDLPRPADRHLGV